MRASPFHHALVPLVVTVLLTTPAFAAFVPRDYPDPSPTPTPSPTPKPSQTPAATPAVGAEPAQPPDVLVDHAAIDLVTEPPPPPGFGIFPLDWGWLSRPVGEELPPTFGVSFLPGYSEQTFRLSNVTINEAYVPYDRSETKVTTYAARVDIWVLSFLNVYGIFGQSKTDATFESGVQGVPSIDLEYDGNVFGVGGTAALPLDLPEGVPGADVIHPFAAFDFNYTRHDLDIFTNTIEIYTFAPRIGATVFRGLAQTMIYGGGSYQSVTRKLVGEVFDAPFTADADLIGPWNGLFGIGYRGLRWLVLDLEGGFGKRKHVIGSVTVRF